MAAIRQTCEQRQVQIIGADINQACYNDSANEIFPEYHTTEAPSRALWGPNGLPEEVRDCVGFFLLPMLLKEGWVMRNVGTWDFDKVEILYLRSKDETAHMPCFVHLHQFLTGRADRRSAAAIEKRRWRAWHKQRNSQPWAYI